MNLFKTIFLFSVISIASIGCSVEQGCTDEFAKNYNSLAEEDDGSCLFTSQIVFFYNEATSASFDETNSISLTYYVDGAIVGSGAANVYYAGTGNPICGDDGSLTVTKEWANSRKKSFSYYIEDQDGFRLYEGNIEFNAEVLCTPVRLN